MATIRGQILAWSFGGVQVENQTDSEISIEVEMDDFTSKDSTGNWKEHAPGLKSWSGSCSGHYDPTATEGADESIDDVIDGTEITVLLTTGVTGNRQFTGSAFINSVSLQAGLSGPVPYSISFTGNGPITAADTTSDGGGGGGGA